MPTINWIEVQGFRAFGQELQKLELSSPVAVVWAPNSQGKTSLAEAFEFLLTGTIVRRELFASSQDEFADSLRNAHLPATTPVYVAAEITGSDGTPHLVKRTLQEDYGKKSSCVSVLEIDGAPADPTDLSTLGLILSQPPLAAPILMQHTLGYLFSAGPKERSLYFKALLEVTDLEDLRNTIAATESSLDIAEDQLLTTLKACAALPPLSAALQPLLSLSKSRPKTPAALSSAAAALLANAGEVTPPVDQERFAALRRLLTDRRTKAFPLNAFDHRALSAWDPPATDFWTTLDTFTAQLAKVDEETRHLSKLFTELLTLPALSVAQGALDCPVCETPAALTPERLATIRAKLQDTAEYQRALAAAQAALRQLDALLQTLTTAVVSACPPFLGWNPAHAEKQGFTAERMLALLGTHGKPLIDAWDVQAKALKGARAALDMTLPAARTFFTGYLKDLPTLTDTASLRSALAAVAADREKLAQALTKYPAAEQPLHAALNQAVDKHSKTEGWEDLLRLTDAGAALDAALADLRAREQVRKDFKKALAEIDRANEKVLDGKFQDLSDGVQRWWDLLRPGEPTFFAAVKPRAGTRRTIDFKAHLSPYPDRSHPKVRDVVAVFSYSQIHCLGLACFLARAVREATGFLIFDDPILSSDDDHRAYFLQHVVEQLITDGYQVIILTQDPRTERQLLSLYEYLNIDAFTLILENHVPGAAVYRKNDVLLAQLAHATTFIQSPDPETRKDGAGRLRGVAERFCKELLVKHRRAQGDRKAVPTDYDGKNLGQLSLQVEPLLTKDPSHPGKLRNIANMLNPGSHDDHTTTPNAGDLKVAKGNLRTFVRDYLKP